MKRKYYYTIIVLFVLNAVSNFAQQNIQFTQYMFNSLSVNPAYAGYKEQWYLQGTVRNQWVSLEGSPITSQLSIDGITNPDNKRIGLGIELTSDKLGPQSTTSFYANYAYRLQLDAEDTKRLCFGLAAGVTQYSINGSLLRPNELGDKVLTTDINTTYIPDVRFGIYYSSPKWYVGASLMDMLSARTFNNENTNNPIVRRPHAFVIGGTLIEATDNIKIRPGFLYKEDFKGPSCIDVNSMFIFKNKFWLGASYRSSLLLWNKQFSVGDEFSSLNSVSAIVQFFLTDDVRIGYSYDYQINGLQYVQQGTHEITLGWTIPTRSQRLLSPRFF